MPLQLILEKSTLKNFILFNLFITSALAAVDVSETDKLFAMQYLSAKTYPDMVSACRPSFLRVLRITSLNSINGLKLIQYGLAKGKVIFEKIAKAEKSVKTPDEFIDIFKEKVLFEFSEPNDKKLSGAIEFLRLVIVNTKKPLPTFQLFTKSMPLNVVRAIICSETQD